MTPQQLIDLLGYGSAQKKLRAMNKWRLTPEEQFQKSIGNIMGSIDDAMGAISDAENDLESALTAMSKTQKSLEETT